MSDVGLALNILLGLGNIVNHPGLVWSFSVAFNSVIEAAKYLLYTRKR